ncbi:hypothetical protein DYB31_013987 [Aphanomyces astaci]|uniref:Uncharacterized protein n=1 Tax=Aphanomyces astaci TaxID=112090 RepID=A0A397FIR8_APHAT|nr:hypothetical protein DYB31_013987 [Aphanomyces astaci]
MTIPSIPINVKPILTTPTLPPTAVAIISSIPTKLPTSVDELAQALNSSTTSRPSSSNSSANSTSADSTASDSFFRIDNGAMWGTFAGATFFGAIVVIVLLRQSTSTDDHRGSSSPYSPAHTKPTCMAFPDPERTSLHLSYRILVPLPDSFVSATEFRSATEFFRLRYRILVPLPDSFVSANGFSLRYRILSSPLTKDVLDV